MDELIGLALTSAISMMYTQLWYYQIRFDEKSVVVSSGLSSMCVSITALYMRPLSEHCGVWKEKLIFAVLVILSF